MSAACWTRCDFVGLFLCLYWQYGDFMSTEFSSCPEDSISSYSTSPSCFYNILMDLFIVMFVCVCVCVYTEVRRGSLSLVLGLQMVVRCHSGQWGKPESSRRTASSLQHDPFRQPPALSPDILHVSSSALVPELDMAGHIFVPFKEGNSVANFSQHLSSDESLY